MQPTPVVADFEDPARIRASSPTLERRYPAERSVVESARGTAHASARGPCRKRPIASATRRSPRRDDPRVDERGDALRRREEQHGHALGIAAFEDAACLAFFDQLDEDREGAGGGLLQRGDLPALSAGEHQLE
jgi:hypothetical protein